MLASQKQNKTPYVYWGQNENKLFVSFSVDSPKNVELNFEKDGLKLYCSSAQDQNYQVDMNLYKEINVEGSSFTIKSQKIECVVEKCESELWSLLTKNNQYKQFIKIDWDKWTELNKDEDPIETPIDMAEMENMQRMMAGMNGGVGGMPGMPGMENLDFSQYMKESENMEMDENAIQPDELSGEKLAEEDGDNEDVIEIDTSDSI